MPRFPAIPARSSFVAAVLLVALTVVVGASAAGRSVTAGFGWKHGRTKLHTDSFRIAADLTVVARPGIAQEVDLRLVNPHRYSLRVSKLTLELVVDAPTRGPAATGASSSAPSPCRPRPTPSSSAPA